MQKPWQSFAINSKDIHLEIWRFLVDDDKKQQQTMTTELITIPLVHANGVFIDQILYSNLQLTNMTFSSKLMRRHLSRPPIWLLLVNVANEP